MHDLANDNFVRFWLVLYLWTCANFINSKEQQVRIQADGNLFNKRPLGCSHRSSRLDNITCLYLSRDDAS
ncbi:hypothetical protein L209DRAFT_349932 [Thermothelomyces heterothallicus CBS 203.75]